MLFAHTTRSLSLLLFAVACCTAASPSRAQKPADDKPALVIELNKLEPIDDGCRIAFVIQNKLGVALGSLAFELVLFDKSQRILTLLSVEAGGFPRTKTRVKQFDIKAIACDGIGRALLNDISECSGNQLTAAMCLKASVPQSRAGIPFTS